MIKWEQMVFLGNPEYGCELQPIDFAAFARACGGDGLHRSRTRPSAARVLDEALATPGPGRRRGGRRSVRAADAAQGHASSRRRKFAESLARGEPNREKIALTVLADKVRELI